MLRPVFPFLEYAANKNYIIKYLCENRSQPRLKCNGKCYLTKQLEANQTNNSSESNEESPSVNLHDYPYALLDHYKQTSNILQCSKSKPEMLSEVTQEGEKNSLFRPPILLS